MSSLFIGRAKLNRMSDQTQIFPGFTVICFMKNVNTAPDVLVHWSATGFAIPIILLTLVFFLRWMKQ